MVPYYIIHWEVSIANFHWRIPSKIKRPLANLDVLWASVFNFYGLYAVQLNVYDYDSSPQVKSECS